MFRIRLHNQISPRGLARLPSGQYLVGSEVADPHAILVRSADLHGLEIPPSLLCVGRAGAGVNNIPVARLSALGIPVFNAPGANANAVRELVIAGMLIAARNLHEALAFVAALPPDAGLEERVEREKRRFVGSELAGRTLGVVGLGAIGVRVANAALALGMRVLGFDPHMTVEGAWQLSAEVRKAHSLDELYGASDFVSFHVPLNEHTRGMFDARALARVRRGVVLLNFAREGVVDAEALRCGLEEGTIARYVCDFPHPDLLRDPRVIALPHLGASTHEAEENCAVMVIDQVRDFLEHGNVQNAVNFPSVRMERGGEARICLANRNVPNMIAQVTQLLGARGINIAQMHNASRGELAYNLLDIEGEADPGLLAELRRIDGVLSVRLA
ncbi:MAG: phosphoglycerate dehydrogenase [Xanthomonadales bacterium]|nr:phosphoglycerate dehydrogenase [Xanthomonadales bacterium]